LKITSNALTHNAADHNMNVRQMDGPHYHSTLSLCDNELNINNKQQQHLLQPFQRSASGQ